MGVLCRWGFRWLNVSIRAHLGGTIWLKMVGKSHHKTDIIYALSETFLDECVVLFAFHCPKGKRSFQLISLGPIDDNIGFLSPFRMHESTNSPSPTLCYLPWGEPDGSPTGLLACGHLATVGLPPHLLSKTCAVYTELTCFN